MCMYYILPAGWTGNLAGVHMLRAISGSLRDLSIFFSLFADNSSNAFLDLTYLMSILPMYLNVTGP